MSIECLNQALKIEGLTPTKKFILVILANYADEQGTCYPSYSHIAKIVGLKDTKGIQRSIKEFEQLGYLKIQHRKTEKGDYTSNKYHLTLGMGISTHRGVETSRVGVSEPSNTKDKTKTNNKISLDVDMQVFNKFWEIYPRKVNKKQTLKIFTKINDNDYEKILHAVKIFASEHTNTEEKFIPHATTWLNQERYEDYINKKFTNKNLNNLAG